MLLFAGPYDARMSDGQETKQRATARSFNELNAVANNAANDTHRHPDLPLEGEGVSSATEILYLRYLCYLLFNFCLGVPA